MKKQIKNQPQNSKFVLEELEARVLFSGGIEGIIASETENPAATYLDIDHGTASLSNGQDDSGAVSAAEQQTHEIVFIDRGVENYQTLVDDLLNNTDGNRNIEVILLDSDRSGIEQISESLRDRGDLDAVHIISHGSDGAVQLGDVTLDAETLNENDLAISVWADAFSESGDILIYGCNLAESEVGRNLLAELGAMTRADVAASDDLTGHASRGGDWVLEHSEGSIEATVAVSSKVQASWTGKLANSAPTLDASEADLWLSSSADVSASTANGLASWTKGEMLQFGAPDLSFGENTTNGTFSSTGFNLDDFAAGADIDALHYVTQTVTVGSGAESMVLIAGDLLLSTQGGEDLTSTNSLSVGHEDIFVFRPDTPGDYSTGTFIFLLEKPTGGGATGVSLVEQDTAVGDVTLNAGTFVLSKGDKNIYHYTADTVGLGTTTGTLSTLIEADDLGVDKNIAGVALVQNPTTAGGVTLTSGQLLVTLDNDDNDVGGFDTERRDVIALNITQTGATTLGSVTGILLDGDDVGLTSNDEDLDALTLVSPLRLNPIIEDTSDVANSGTQVSDLIDNLTSDVDLDAVGIAITAVDDTSGTWQYSINGGATWLAIGSVTDNSARVLTATANDLIRFVPDPEFGGNATIDFRAWDGSDLNTTGTAGVDASLNGGATAFSSATATGIIEVREINDALLTLPPPQSTTEEVALVFSNGNSNAIIVSDIDDPSASVQITLSAINGDMTLSGITGLSFTTGTGTDDGSMVFTGSPADVNSALDGLSFSSPANYVGQAQITIQVNDQGNSGTGGPLTDSGLVSITVVSDGVNDAPLNSVPATQYNNIDAQVVFNDANSNLISISDDSGNLPLEVTLTATDGTLTLSSQDSEELQVNALGTNAQLNTQVATSTDGAYVIVWQSDGDQDGDKIGIFAQLYDPVGNAVGGEITVNTETTDDQVTPVVAMSATGSFVVAWESDGSLDGDGKGIFMQVFDPSGNKVDVESQANTTSVDDQTAPAIAMDDSGKFIVTWQSKNQDGDGQGIYAQRFDANGFTLGDEFLVTSTITDDQTLPSVAMNAGGNFVVAWQSKNQDGDGDGIFAQRFDALGVAQGVEFQVNVTSADKQRSPDVAIDDLGNFVITWQSDNQDGNGWGVYTRHFDAAGTAIDAADVLVNTTFSNDQLAPSVSMNALGEHVIVWQSKNQDGDGEGVYGQWFASNGTAVGNEFLLSTETADDQTAPDIALTDVGHFITTWISKNQDGDGEGVYSQKFPSVAGLNFTTGDGVDDASMVFTGRLSQINSVLDGMTFTPAAGFNGTATLTVQVDDLGNTGSGGSLTDDDTVLLQFNTAPVLDNSGTMSFTAIDEDDVTNSGNLVSEIVTSATGDRITDANTSPLEGIAITAVNDTDGSWEYSTNGGGAWVAFGSVSSSSSVVLGVSANDRIRFVPNAEYSGTVTSGITFHAWDQTDGNASGTSGVDVSVNGGSTAYSTATETADIVVNIVDDLPIATGNTVVADENVPLVFGVSDFKFTDAEGDALVSVTITGLNLNGGTLTHSAGAVNVTNSMTVTAAEIADLTFTSALNDSSDSSFTYTVNDAGVGVTSAVMNITVNAEDDAAVITGDVSFTGDEGDAVVGDLNATDVEGLTDNTYFTVSGAATNGTAAIDAETGAWTFTPTDANWFGSDSFTVTVTDDLGGTTTQVVSITLANVDDAAVITGDVSFTGDEGDAVVGDLNATDVEGLTDNTYFTVSGAATNGTAAIDAETGAWTFTPTDANWFGSDSFTVTVTDDLGGTTTQVVSITLANVDDAAVITGDVSFTGDEGDAVVGDLNATDVEGLTDNTYFTVSGAATNGTAAIDAETGAWTFTPTDANWFGSDSFTVTVTDDLGGTTTQVVSITLANVDDAAVITGDVSFTGDEGDAVVGDLNATDVEGLTDNTYFTVSSAATSGTAVIDTETGAWTFTPTDANWFGSDSFTVTVTDDLGGTTTQVVSITLANVDDAAVITGDVSFTGDEGDAVVGDLNATDVEGLTDNTYFTVSSAATSGTAVIDTETGAWTFTPTDSNWFGSDSFTVAVTDDLGGTTTQVVSITLANVDDAAVITGDVSFTGDEGDAVVGDLNATDVEGLTDNTYFTVSSDATNGTAAIDAETGAWTFTPTDTNWFGSDSFTVTVTDDLGGTTTQVVSITLANVDDAAVITGDVSFTGDEGNAVAGDLNATDVEGLTDNTYFTVSGAATNGTAAIDAETGAWTFAPTDTNWFGSDSFTVTVTDDLGGTTTQVVSITLANADSSVITGDLSFTGDEGDVVTGDLDATDVDGLTDNTYFNVSSDATNGTAAIDAETGAWTFTPTDANWFGSDSFAVTVTDDLGGTTTRAVSITLANVDDAAVITGDVSFTGDEGNAVAGDLNATDVEGLTDNTYFTVSSDATNGTAAIDPETGAWTFTPTDGNWFGSDSFTVTVTDDLGGTTTQVVSITLANVDDAAVITGDVSFTGDEGDAIVGDLNATDVEGLTDNTYFTVSSAAANGTAAIDADTGTWTFTPTDANWFGSDSFTVTVTDDLGGTTTQVVSITLANVDDAAVITGDVSFTGDEGDAGVGDLNATDVEGLTDNTYFTVSSAATNGTAVIDPETGAWTFTPTDANWFGSDSFTVTVTDDLGGTTTQVVSITLANVDDASVITGDVSFTGDEGDAVAGDLNATDVEGFTDNTYFTVSSDATNGTAVIDPETGAWTFTPTDTNWFGSDSFTVTVTDDLDGTTTQVVSITLANVDDAAVITGDVSFTGDEGDAIVGDLNATDVEGLTDNTYFTVSSAAANGTAAIDADTGTWTFTPTDANWFGSDSFTVTVTDDLGGTTTQVVSITLANVDDAAVITGDVSFTGDEGDAVFGDLNATDVEGLTDNTYFTVSSDATNGTAVIDPETGAWTFTPTDANWFGSDSFTVTVTDDLGGTTTQVVSITLANVDDAAVITGDVSFTGDEGDAVFGDLNATDVEGLTDNTYFTVSSNATNGTAAIDAETGAWTFTPTDANWIGSDSFTVTVTDDLDGTTTQVVSITLANVDDAAVITGDVSFTGDEGDAIVGDLNATDVEGLTDNSYFTVSSAAANGTAAIDAETGAWTFTPTDANWFGSDSFTVTVTDDLGGTTTQVVSITLANVDDVPVIGGVDTGTVQEDVDVVGNQISTTGVLTVADPDAGESSFEAGTVNGSYGDLTIKSDGSWSYSADNTQSAIQQLDAQESVTDTMGITTADGTTKSVTITINGNEDAPFPKNTTADHVVIESQTFSYILAPDLFVDLDRSDTLSYAATLVDGSALPRWLRFDGDTQTFTGVAPTADIGSISVKVIVDDGSSTAFHTLTFNVKRLGVATTTTDDSSFQTYIAPEAPVDSVDDGSDANPETSDSHIAGDPLIELSPATAADSDAAAEPKSETETETEAVIVSEFDTVLDIRGDDQTEQPDRVDAENVTDSGDGNTTRFNHDGLDSKSKLDPRLQALKDYLANKSTSDLYADTVIELDEEEETTLWATIDSLHQQMDKEMAQEESSDIEVELIVSSTAGVTAGVIGWILRGGALLTSLMTSIPLISRFDPLPIVKRKDHQSGAPSDESIEDGKQGKQHKTIDKLFSNKNAAN